MADKLKTIDKEFLLSDSSVNSYGFRLLTSGYLMSEFKKNPIGYFMHGKGADHPREQGVLVKWTDLRADGDKIYAKPVINLNHPRGQKSVEEVENGFLNAASVGHLIILETSSDEKDILPGQTGKTVTKWFNREASLVDVPGNFNALTELYDKDENPINLADLTTLKLPTMKKIEITGAQLSAINLKAEATEVEFGTAFNDLVALAGKANQLQTDLSAANTKVGTLETEIAGLKKSGNEKEVADLIAKGIEDKRLTVEVGNKLKTEYAEKPAALKDLIASFPVYESLTKSIDAEKEKKDARYNELAAMSADKLMETGKMEIVQKEFPDLYAKKSQELKDLVK